MANQRETKNFRLEVKDLNDLGQFTGYASVYNIVDSYNDIVQPGAFTKTIQERGARVPILWQHNADEPIGMGQLVDSEHGLIINGQLELELPEAQKAYVRLKKGIADGLSIGYRVIADAMEKGKRLLKEIKLYEVSLVLMPANELALVTQVKAEPVSEPEPEKELPDVLNLIEQKAGRTISAATRSQIEQIVQLCNALLASDDTSTPNDGAAKGVSVEPPKDSKEPDPIHSLLEQFKSNLRSTR